MAKAFRQRISFRFGSAGIALSNSAIQPFERFVRFSAICVGLGNLVGGVVLMSGDKFLQGAVGLVPSSEPMIGQRLTGKLLPLAGFLLHLRHSLLRVPLREENLAASQVERRELRI